MGSFQWYMTAERVKLIKAAKKVPEYGKRDTSELLEEALREFVKKHGESQNPQTKVTLFLNEHALAIPNAYASPEAWYKFYEIIRKDKPAFLELDKQLQMIMRTHEAVATMYGLRICQTF